MIWGEKRWRMLDKDKGRERWRMSDKDKGRERWRRLDKDIGRAGNSLICSFANFAQIK